MSVPAASGNSGKRSDVLIQFGSRIGRDTVVYALGTAIVLPFSLVTVAVLTRYLTPAEYGQLAVLFVFSGLLTTLYNVGSLQGTLMWVFGSSGDEVEAAATGGAASGTKRRALGSGLGLTTLIVTVATIPILLFAVPIRDLLLGGAAPPAAVRWAAASAAFGSLWRLVINVFRMERRPRTFATLNALRPTFVLGCSIPLVATGHGATGAVAGTALGTAVGVLVCLFLGRRSYAVGLHREDVRRIVSMGSRFVALVVALWVVHNADVYVLSRFEAERDVGLYRLAGRVAAFLSYFVSSFLMAWGPLEATSLFQATYARHGRPGVRSRLITYYLVIALTLLLAMAVSAEVLVRIAAPAYAAAAPLIAPIGFGFVAYGGFIVLARSATIAHRNLVYGTLAVGCAALFSLLAVLLIPPFGGYGAALAVALSMFTGCIIFMVLIARAEQPVPFEYGRLLGVLTLALGAYAAMRWGAPAAGSSRSLVDAGIFAAFLVALLGFRIVPLAHLRPLGRMAASMLPARGNRSRLLEATARLASSDQLALELVARRHLPPEEAAQRLGAGVDELLAALVRALRGVEGRGTSTDADARIGAYLVREQAPAERDALAQRLWESGVDPLDLHELETTLAQVRAIPRRRWRTATPQAAAE